MNGFEGPFAQIVQSVTSFQTGLAEVLKSIRIPDDFMANIKRFAEWHSQLPEATKRGANRLAELGWHIGPDLPMTAHAWAHDSHPPDEIDARFAEAYELQIESVERWIGARFPLRSSILKLAFEAHRRGEFGLSIPVFFAQAEGMCRDILADDANLFTSNAGKAHSRNKQIESCSKEISVFIDALLDPLRRVLPMGAAIGDSRNYPVCPNRHAILHGYSVDYATRVNSLKAISLIAYLGWVLPKLESERGSASED